MPSARPGRTAKGPLKDCHFDRSGPAFSSGRVLRPPAHAAEKSLFDFSIATRGTFEQRGSLNFLDGDTMSQNPNGAAWLR